uniref:fibrillin-2-like isoform X1 n=1 Tax=Styela clava TaxID=7725 RepID=UPI001939D623|nr:fibrillin-2-like isoform X1 [Styela clava]
MRNICLFLISIVALQSSQIDAQANTACPTCVYGVALQDGSGSVIKRFRNSTADAASSQASFVSAGLGFTALTGTAACAASVCGTAGSETCVVNAADANVFECGCTAQYAPDRYTQAFSCVDLDECANATLNNCSSTGGVCTNQAPGFSCACAAQYTGDGVTCTDFDECAASSTHNCSGNATCTNTAPGFTCACNAQYTGDGYTCTDIDECTLGTQNCSLHASCSNTDPGFTCTCNAQYTGDGYNCADIDECTLGTANCSTDGFCTNTVPGFTCTCNALFTGDGVNCTDLDECLSSSTNNCSTNADCTNLVPGFSCACKAGYTGDGINCTDISECASSPCDANANCTEPTANNYTCTCNTGYTGNGTSCADIDECPAVITMGLLGSAPVTNPCHDNATCTNNIGSYTCECNDGFTGNGTSCTEIDECLTNPCNVNADCTDLVNNYTCVCKTGFSGDGVTLCEKQRTNITISFFVTCVNQIWDINLSSAGTPININITSLLESAIRTFVNSVDNSAGIFSLVYTFTNSSDGMGSAQAGVSLTINNTNIDAVEFLKKVNTIVENTQCGAVASADECGLGIDTCGSDSVCGNSDYGFCCFYSYEYRFEVKYNTTFIPAYSNVSSTEARELFDDAEAIAGNALSNAQNRGCKFTVTFEDEGIEQGSSIGVILMRVVNGTKQATDIAAELAKAVGQTTSFGTIISAGDYDECARNYTSDRNCSAFATCLNFAGSFSCECNSTYYDNGTTSTGEICITPITIDCNGTQATISVLQNYYTQKNVSLNSLHLADEACNISTHGNLLGDSIHFVFSLNDCNTTFTQSTDNSSIIASNYISNVPSSGFFTGHAINVPFQCNLPSTVNATIQYNSSVANIDFPTSESTGGATVALTAYSDSAFQHPLTAGDRVNTTSNIYLKAFVFELIQVSVVLKELTAKNSRGTDSIDLIKDGCKATNEVPFLAILSNGNGASTCMFQAFTFTDDEVVDIVATAFLCAGTCQQTCSSRRRRDVSDLMMPGTQEVVLSLTIKVRPSSNGTMIVDGIVVNNNNKPSSDVHDITLPIVAAILAFVLIVLLALVVVVVVRKQRHSNKEYDVSHINMHAIGVKPPSYE